MAPGGRARGQPRAAHNGPRARWSSSRATGVAEPSTTGIAEPLRAAHRHVARRVAQALLLLVRGVVLLVDDDDAQVAERHQHREPRAQHDARGAGLRREPRRRRARPRRGGCARRRRARPAKRLRTCVLELRGKPDLGDQQQRLAPRGERAGDGVQVDLGLAAAGDPVQQDGVEACSRRPRSRLDRGGLLGCQRMGRGAQARVARLARCGAAIGAPAHLAQSRRQARGDHLAQRALVVRGAELEELELGLAAAAARPRPPFRPPAGAPAATALASLTPTTTPDLARAAERHHHEASEARLEALAEGRKSNASSSGTSRATRTIFTRVKRASAGRSKPVDKSVHRCRGALAKRCAHRVAHVILRRNIAQVLEYQWIFQVIPRCPQLAHNLRRAPRTRHV